MFNKKRSFKIYLTKGRYNGVHTWHYVKVDALKQPLFQKAIQSGNIDVTEYGEILFSGWGKEPPESISDQIKDYN
jgi:hypothetical protein